MISLPRSTQIPNEIINGWLPKLTESELKVLIIIARQTLGWIENPKTGMRKEEDWMTNKQIKEKTGIKSKRALSGAIKSLLQKRLIEIRTKSGKLLDTTQKRQKAGREHERFFYRLVMGQHPSPNAPWHGDETSPRHGDKMSPRHGDKSIPNKTNSYKTNSLQKRETPKKKYSSIGDIKEEDLVEISQRYKVTLGFVKLQFEKMKNWLESSGKKKKNYKATLRNFVLGDMQKQIERRQSGKYRAVDARNL